MSFELHPTLARDTLPVAELGISQLLLMNDARFPWCILVPQRVAVSEWHHLPPTEQVTVMEEITAVSNFLEHLPQVSKLNVGALGNRVPQLHIHVLGRHPDDPAWPDPVWGFGTPVAYEERAADLLVRQLRAALTS